MGDIPDIMLNVGNTLLSFLGPVPAIAADAVNAVAEATKMDYNNRGSEKKLLTNSSEL